MIKVEIDTDLVKKIENDLGDMKEETPKVMVRALNRSAQNVQSNMKKVVRERYTIKASEIKNKIVKEKATYGNLSVSVRAKSQKLGLDKFKYLGKPQVKRTSDDEDDEDGGKKKVYKRKKVKVEIIKGQKKILKGGFVEGIGEGDKRRNFIWKRAPDAKKVKSKETRKWSSLPIMRVRGPSLPSMIAHKSNEDKIMEEASEVLQKRIDHEIKRILEKKK